MRHNVMGRKLNRSSGQRKALFRNLTTELFRHNRIKTTEAKAKTIQPIAEKLVTLARRGDLHKARHAGLLARRGQSAHSLRMDRLKTGARPVP